MPGLGLCFNRIVPLDAVEVSGLKVTEEQPVKRLSSL